MFWYRYFPFISPPHKHTHSHTTHTSSSHLSSTPWSSFIWITSPTFIPISALIWELIGADNGSFRRMYPSLSFLVHSFKSPLSLHVGFFALFFFFFFYIPPFLHIFFFFDCKMNGKNYKITARSGKRAHVTCNNSESKPPHLPAPASVPTSSHPPSTTRTEDLWRNWGVAAEIFQNGGMYLLHSGTQEAHIHMHFYLRPITSTQMAEILMNIVI